MRTGLQHEPAADRRRADEQQDADRDHDAAPAVGIHFLDVMLGFRVLPGPGSRGHLGDLGLDVRPGRVHRARGRRCSPVLVRRTPALLASHAAAHGGMDRVLELLGILDVRASLPNREHRELGDGRPEAGVAALTAGLGEDGGIGGAVNAFEGTRITLAKCLQGGVVDGREGGGHRCLLSLV